MQWYLGPGMDEITLGLEWFLNPDHVPFVVADERGYYEAEGLDVELWEPPEHHDTLEMLADGDLDYAITEPIHLVPERSAGVPVTGIARFLHTRGGIQYPADRGGESPADLESGVRLNYPGAPGPGGRRMVAYMAREAGGDLTADEIEPVDRGFYHTDALVEGDADVAFLAFYNFEIVESRHRGFDADLWELADYGVPDFNQLVLAAADGTVEDGEAAVELFFQRYPELRDDDPELMDEIAAATREFFTPDLSQDVEMYRDLVAFCEELELSDGPVDVNEVADERFVG